jgi:DNA repair protein RecN (Recombination protein N)
MLNQLHIQNFALIEDLTLDLKSGLNIITGETGAGKSILLGALGLLSGKRAEISVVRKGTKKCIVEGSFSLGSYGLANFFTENDLDFEEPSIIRREVAVSGKSRAFINDTPVTLSILKLLGDKVIDVHSQHANLLLTKPEFSFKLLDDFAHQNEKLEKYQVNFKAWQALKIQRSELEETQKQEKLNLEFNQFQLNELTAAALKEGEQGELEKEFEVLNNAEEIKECASIVVNNTLYSASSVQEMMQESISALDKLSGFDERYQSLKDRMASSLIEVKDVAEGVEQISGSMRSDAQRTKEIDDRLSLLFSLQKKYNVASVEQLITKRESLKKAVNLVLGGSDVLDALHAELKKSEYELGNKADILSKGRIKSGKFIADRVIDDLKLMGIENAQLQFEIKPIDLSVFGKDQVNILFSANKGTNLGWLIKTASGGELSRVMLGLKKVMSEKSSLPTIVFDEIDTGVSGEVANKIGALMKEMGTQLQVITITHLPQIAAKGNAHFKVFKYHDEYLTTSQIKELKNESRVEEIAEMLSGSEVSEAARKNATELMS